MRLHGGCFTKKDYVFFIYCLPYVMFLCTYMNFIYMVKRLACAFYSLLFCSYWYCRSMNNGHYGKRFSYILQ